MPGTSGRDLEVTCPMRALLNFFYPTQGWGVMLEGYAEEPAGIW
jgi:hypothetical protein